MTLDALLSRLHAPQLATIELSLGRVAAHLDAAGNPHHRLPPVIHVAGTNGKGSTIAFLRAVLEAAGYRCHVFTSPHLVRFNERIVVAGEQVTDAALQPVLERIVARYDQYPLTFFEANTVAAFELFAETPADVVLLEVGMGGRFDATNVIAAPLLSIITPVSFDHTEFLGDSLAKIAYEKTGIIKAGCPVVVAPQEPEALAVIEQVAADMASPLLLSCQLNLASNGMTEPLSLSGAHQRMNAMVACTAIDDLRARGWNISDEAMSNGLAHARWPARLQRLPDPATGWQLWLDGGHNPSAAAVLADWAQQRQPLHLVVGMTAHKDAAAFLGVLAPAAASVHLVEIPDEPMAMSLNRLTEAANAANVTAVPHKKGVMDAIAMILEANRPDSGYILICGSLYLAGFVLGKLESSLSFPRKRES